MIVKRGPQFVQLVNGYSYRRSAGVEQLAPAVVAGRDVRGDELVGVRVRRTLDDDEAVVPFVRRRRARHRGDVGARRRLLAQAAREGVEKPGPSLGVDLDTG